MSLIKVLPEYLEKFSLTLHPQVRYVSSSVTGPTGLTTGSMPLSIRPSRCFKNIIDPSQIGQNSYDINSDGVPGFNAGDFSIIEDLEAANRVVKAAKSGGTSADVSSTISKYMELVNSSSEISRNSKRFDIVRFDPPFTFNINTSVKNCIRNVLMPFYSPRYDYCQFSYTNYNTLNFFSGSGLPGESAIIYNNFKFPDKPRPYSPTGSFSFDFYINPRYSNERGKDFKAGTILHLSSTYAISLVSGSQLDQHGLVSGFRIMLQLSHSADVDPSNVDLNIPNNQRSYPQDLIFLSPDNTLKKNNWHHTTIRWGGSKINAGTGSIHIDPGMGSESRQGFFEIPSSSILPPKHIMTSALFMGNYFSGWADEAKFFNENAGLNEGVYPYEDFSPLNEDPDENDYKLNHPLQAEIHDVKIYDRYITDHHMIENETMGISPNTKDFMGLMFYVPPFFTPTTQPRENLITPFQTETKSSSQPFNPIFSFGVGGYIINLPNFVKEFKNNYFPRLFHLTASTIDTTVVDITANGYIFASGSTKKRNLTILPNDNGRFYPDFELLRPESRISPSSFENVWGGVDLSIININNMVPASSAYSGLPTVSARDLEMINESLGLPDDTSSDSIAAQIAGVTPENMTLAGQGQGPILTIYQRTRDPSSNEITIFDISNLFYGNTILPKSFYLTDPSVTGSSDQIKITLRDNSRGSLYRADCLTEHASWANVGTVLYNEGVAVVKSPHIAYFGVDGFEASFKGEQNIHLLTVNLPAGVGAFNSSSNPQYKVLSASNNANDLNSRFVYISGINLHDDNLNVIMRANLAQPVLKREEDEVMLRFKMDF